jgi:hypothetical protein
VCRNYIYNIMHTDRVASSRAALQNCGRGRVHTTWCMCPNLHSRGMYVYTHMYADMSKYVCVCMFVRGYICVLSVSVGTNIPRRCSAYIKIYMHRMCNRTDKTDPTFLLAVCSCPPRRLRPRTSEHFFPGTSEHFFPTFFPARSFRLSLKHVKW